MWQRMSSWGSPTSTKNYESKYDDLSITAPAFPLPISRESFQYVPASTKQGNESTSGKSERFRITINTEGFEPHEIDVRVENRKIHIKACREETIRSCQSTKKIERTYDIPMDADVHGMSLSFPDRNSMIIEFPVLPFSFSRSKYYNPPRVTRQETTKEVTRVFGSSDSRPSDRAKSPETPRPYSFEDKNRSFVGYDTKPATRELPVVKQTSSDIRTSSTRPLSREVLIRDEENERVNDRSRPTYSRAFSSDRVIRDSSSSRIVRAKRVPVIDDSYHQRTRSSSDVFSHFASSDKSCSLSPSQRGDENALTPVSSTEAAEFSYDSFYRSSFSPKVVQDVITGVKKFVMNLDVVGYEPGDIKVSIQGNDLRVEGEHFVNESGKTSRKYFLKEVALPPETKKQEVKSVLINGNCLQIEAPIYSSRA